MLELTRIPAVSPSLAEVLRLCPLRAGLSRLEGASQYVLGQPKAWLGIAYHAVLEESSRPTSDANRFEAAWLAAIEAQRERALAHPLDRRFGPPERWPGYHLVHAMALMRAREAAVSVQSLAPLSSSRERKTGREQWLSASGGRLVGKPDLIRDDAVIDYKTGDIYEDGESKVARASYVRQLQIYAFLVRECSGKWPRRGVLLPMEGSPLAVDLEPGTCENVATEALQLLDKYNFQIQVAGDPVKLANPSPEGCRWCPYQVLCPAFWTASVPSTSEPSGPATVGGLALSQPQPIHGGAAFALSLFVDEGTGPIGEVVLAPLRPEIHASLAPIQVGQHVRVTGLMRRADGSVVPSARTLIACVDDIPEIKLSS